MRRCLILLLACSVTAAHAQHFELKTTNGEVTGPFEMREGAVVSVGDAKATVTNVRTHRDETIEAMSRIRIPEVDFRQANIRDVVDFLHQSSVEFDEQHRGMSIVLKLCPRGRAANRSCPADPFAAPEDLSNTNSVPEELAEPNLVTFSALDITLKEALDIVVDVCGLKYRIRDRTIVLMDKQDSSGDVFALRMYDILPTAIKGLTDLARACGNRDQHEPSVGYDFTAFFTEMGVQWPNSSSVEYVRGLGKLVVYNTVDNLREFENILGHLNIQPVQIEIEVQYVSFAAEDIGELAITGITMASLLELWKEGKGEFLAAPRVITQSGQQATVKGVTEYIYPTEFSVPHATGSNVTCKAGSFPVEPGSFETREVGTLLEVMPEISPDGGIINLTLSPELVTEPSWEDYGMPYTDATGNKQEAHMRQPFFETCQIRSNILLASGHRVLISGGTPTRDGTRMTYMFLTATKIGMRGEVIGE